MFVKILTDILSNQISFRVVNFFYCFFNSEQHYIDPEKKSSSKRLPSSFNGVFTFKKMEFYIQFYYQFFMP